MGDGLGVAFCGKLLAGLGYSVVKVEPPGGDPSRNEPPLGAGSLGGAPSSLLFSYLNMGKRSVTLDLTKPAGGKLLKQLASGSEIVVIGGQPIVRSLAEWAEEFRKVGGLRVIAALTPYGESGPYRDYAATELTLQAMGGLARMVGESGREPLVVYGHQAEYCQGLAAFTAVMVCLLSPRDGSEPLTVEVSAMETLAYLEWKSWTFFESSGVLSQRGASSQWLRLRCSDGMVAVAYLDSDWQKVHRPGWRTKLGRPQVCNGKGTSRALW